VTKTRKSVYEPRRESCVDSSRIAIGLALGVKSSYITLSDESTSGWMHWPDATHQTNAWLVDRIWERLLARHMSGGIYVFHPPRNTAPTGCARHARGLGLRIRTGRKARKPAAPSPGARPRAEVHQSGSSALPGDRIYDSRNGNVSPPQRPPGGDALTSQPAAPGRFVRLPRNE